MRLRGEIKSLFLLLGILLVSPHSLLAQTNVCPQVAGNWVSSAGSKLTLVVNGNTLSGTFERAGTTVPVNGSASSQSTDGNCPLSFSASWPGGGHAPTVTSYTGRLESQNSRIRAVFLLVDPTESTYASVSVSLDFFYRTAEEAAKAEKEKHQ